MKYDPALIEKKWQQFWSAHATFRACEDPAKPKYYVLDMFPYPSGAGLHVGHLIGYTATDVVGRYKLACGFSVLHPMGWDSFGLPAEQYAIRTGTHPAHITHVNIHNFKRQLMAMGYGYDWERELATSDPTYYKWTQWLFTKLYERGLAYQADMLVNWCPAVGTVLANEEIENGRAKEGGHPIERRPLKQWMLRITAYAERLLHDLDLLDWPEGLKRLQRNWIGRSEGAEITFSLAHHPHSITVFTTRPDTLFGVSYLVLAPEHPLVKQIVTQAQGPLVEEYLISIAAKSDFDRTEGTQEKTGVFTGAYALHPATQELVPIWVADYVLMGYGTGAVMAVPAHDARDFAFAQQFNLPIRQVITPPVGEEGAECWTGEGVCCNSRGVGWALDGLSAQEAKKVVVEWLEAQGIGARKVSYKLRDWLFSRQRYWGEPFPLLHEEGGGIRLLELDELPLIPPEVTEYKPTAEGQSPLAKVTDWVEIIDPKTGKAASRETHTMPQWAGSCWYYLRFCDPHNTEAAWAPEKEKYWMAVDLYVGGAEHAVLHLLYARFWHKVFYDCGLVHTLEPFQRLLNQGLVMARSYQKENGAYVSPSEVVEREGQFFHWETGEQLTAHVDKMSKSKLNGVSPDEILEEMGADALRLYAMFLGPVDKEKVWNTEAVSGCRRFLNRFFEMATSDKVQEGAHEEGMRLAHCLVAGVTHDLDNILLNTAIAKMMEFLNAFTKLPLFPKQAVLWATQMLAPFAPHMAEEVWAHLGGSGSIAHAPWPVADPRFLQATTCEYVVQVNGKVRGRFTLPVGATQEEVHRRALEDPLVHKYAQGEIVKVVFVPEKLLSLVVR